MKPLTVLWVIDHVCYDGNLHGGGRLYWNLLPRFDATRVRVVPCLLRASPEIRELFAKSPVPVRILDKGKLDPTTVGTFLQLIRQEQVDVMHLHCYGASTFGRLASALTGVPAVIHDYDTEVYFPYPSYLWLADRLLAPVTRRAFAASPMVREFQIRRRGIDGSRIQMMLHAIPAEKFAPVSDARMAQARTAARIGPEDRVAVTVTKLGPQRGNEELLDAVAVAVKTVPTLRLVLAYKPTRFHRLPDKRYVDVSQTDQARATELEARLRRLGIERHVRLIEMTKAADIDALIAIADVFVAPFLSARFSSVGLLEAMALGKPVIATDLGEAREFIRDDVNGYLVAAGQPDALARRLAGLLSDPSALSRLSRGARETAQAHSVETYVKDLQTLYGTLARGGASK